MTELDMENFNQYLRMHPSQYQELLSLATPFIPKKDTVMQKAITPNERLFATLIYLATGQTFNG